MNNIKSTRNNINRNNKTLFCAMKKVENIIKRTRGFQLKSRPKFDVRSTFLEDEESQVVRRGKKGSAGWQGDLIRFRFDSPRGKPLFRLNCTTKRA